jgi:hypothetical protein
MRLAPAIAFSLIVVSSVPASAYTQRDASACMSDAFRLCAASIPDAHRVANCLYIKRRQLSPACAGAFARYTRTGAHRRLPRPVVSSE